MAVSLLIASAVSITAFILLTRVLGKRMKFFKKLILNDSTNTESGYVSNQTRTDLMGKVGVTFTPRVPPVPSLLMMNVLTSFQRDRLQKR